MNKVILTGNLVRDCELKQTQSGKSVVSNAVAVRRDMKDANGEYGTDFIEFVAWGNQAEYISRYGRKGDRVEIVGRWQQRNFSDRNGNNRRVDECIVESISAFSRQDQQQTAPKQTEKPQAPSFDDISDDNLPF